VSGRKHVAEGLPPPAIKQSQHNKLELDNLLLGLNDTVEKVQIIYDRNVARQINL